MANPFQLPMAWRAVRNLFSRPVTRRYPAEVRARPPGARGRVSMDISACVFCGLCARRCPCEAIVVSKTEKTVAFEHLRCISCGSCVDACNKDSLALLADALGIQERGGLVERVHREEPEKKTE